MGTHATEPVQDQILCLLARQQWKVWYIACFLLLAQSDRLQTRGCCRNAGFARDLTKAWGPAPDCSPNFHLGLRFGGDFACCEWKQLCPRPNVQVSLVGASDDGGSQGDSCWGGEKEMNLHRLCVQDLPDSFSSCFRSVCLLDKGWDTSAIGTLCGDRSVQGVWHSRIGSWQFCTNE